MSKRKPTKVIFGSVGPFVRRLPHGDNEAAKKALNNWLSAEVIPAITSDLKRNLPGEIGIIFDMRIGWDPESNADE